MLCLLPVGSAIVAIPANYFRTRGLNSAALLVWASLVWAGIIAVIAYSVIRQQRSPADYGFSLRPGGVASLAVLALIHVYLIVSGKFVMHAAGSYMWSTWGVLMEELVFRSIAIDQFILLTNGLKRQAFWAILASSALWSVPHIVTKSPAQLVGGIFLGGLLFGYVYYKSRSILLPAWIHAVANAGYLGGLLIAALYCVIGVADCAMASPNKHASNDCGLGRVATLD